MQFIKLLKLTLIVLPLYAPAPKELLRISDVVPDHVKQEELHMQFCTSEKLFLSYPNGNRGMAAGLIDLKTKKERSFPVGPIVSEHGSNRIWYHEPTGSLFVEQISQVQHIHDGIERNIEGYNRVIGLGDEHALLFYTMNPKVVGLLSLQTQTIEPVELDHKFIPKNYRYDYDQERALLAYVDEHDTHVHVRDLAKQISHEITPPKRQKIDSMTFVDHKLIATVYDEDKPFVAHVTDLNSFQPICQVNNRLDLWTCLDDKHIISTHWQKVFNVGTQQPLPPIDLGTAWVSETIKRHTA